MPSSSPVDHSLSGGSGSSVVFGNAIDNKQPACITGLSSFCWCVRLCCLLCASFWSDRAYFLAAHSLVIALRWMIVVFTPGELIGVYFPHFRAKTRQCFMASRPNHGIVRESITAVSRYSLAIYFLRT